MMTNPLMIGLRNVLRQTGVTKVLAHISSGGDYEKKYTGALQEAIQTGDVVWDVGANVGYYSTRFSDWIGSTGRVYAFEPSPQNRKHLEMQCSGRENISIFPVGLSRTSERVSMAQGEDNLGATSRVVVGKSSGAGLIEIELRSGDELIAQGEAKKPNVLKIDVEGHELDVILGLERALLDPELRSVLIEVHFGILQENGRSEAPSMIEERLRDAGFDIRWVDPSHMHASRAKK